MFCVLGLAYSDVPDSAFKCSENQNIILYHRANLNSYTRNTNIRVQNKKKNYCLEKVHYRPITNLSKYLLIYLLTPWSRVLLERLTDSQLVKQLPAFYGTESSLPTLRVSATRPSPEPDQSSP